MTLSPFLSPDALAPLPGVWGENPTIAGRFLQSHDIDRSGKVLHAISTSHHHVFVPLDGGTIVVFDDKSFVLAKHTPQKRYNTLTHYAPLAFSPYTSSQKQLNDAQHALDTADTWPAVTDALLMNDNKRLPPWAWAETFTSPLAGTGQHTKSHNVTAFLTAYRILCDWLCCDKEHIIGSPHYIKKPTLDVPTNPALDAWVKTLIDHPKTHISPFHRYGQILQFVNHPYNEQSYAIKGMPLYRGEPAFESQLTITGHERLTHFSLFEEIAHANPALRRPA